MHVVDEEFLDDVGKSPASVIQLIVQQSIATWGSDVSWSLCDMMLVGLDQLTNFIRNCYEIVSCRLKKYFVKTYKNS